MSAGTRAQVLSVQKLYQQAGEERMMVTLVDREGLVATDNSSPQRFSLVPEPTVMAITATKMTYLEQSTPRRGRQHWVRSIPAVEASIDSDGNQSLRSAFRRRTSVGYENRYHDRDAIFSLIEAPWSGQAVDEVRSTDLSTSSSMWEAKLGLSQIHEIWTGQAIRHAQEISPELRERFGIMVSTIEEPTLEMICIGIEPGDGSGAEEDAVLSAGQYLPVNGRSGEGAGIASNTENIEEATGPAVEVIDAEDAIPVRLNPRGW